MIISHCMGILYDLYLHGRYYGSNMRGSVFLEKAGNSGGNLLKIFYSGIQGPVLKRLL